MSGRVERELRRVLVPQQLRRRQPNRPQRRHFRPQVRAERRRRRGLPGRDGRPATRRPTGPGPRRGRRPLPPSATSRAGPVLLPRRRRETQAVHGAIRPLVPRPTNNHRADGPGARLRQPRPGRPHHEADGPALRQLALVRQPVSLRHGRLPGQRRVRHQQSPKCRR